MGTSAVVQAVDRIEKALAPFLREHGFTNRRRTFNRKTIDGLTHVIHLQMGRFDPPGTPYIPGVRENLYGSFTVNLGVYVPEVALLSFPPKSWIKEWDCSIRTRLGILAGDRDIWWRASHEAAALSDIRERLIMYGLPFLDSLRTRADILARPESLVGGRDAYAIAPIILAKRGEIEHARWLLSKRLREAEKPYQAENVRKFAARLGIGELTPDSGVEP